MLPQILAMTVGGPDGVDIGVWPFIVGSLPFVIVIILIVMLTWYFMNKKRLEHQQIMAAIEKGTPLSELRPIQKTSADWIRNITAGIASLLVGIGIAVIVLTVQKLQFNDDTGIGLCFALVFFAIGVARLVRGILQRKAEKALSSDKSALDTNKGF
jgi:hypothetical protein